MLSFFQASLQKTVNEQNSGREEVGDYKIFGGETFLFLKGEQFTKFANFTMTINHHGFLSDKSKAFLITCTKKDSTTFVVPVCMADLDGCRKVYSKFQKYRPKDTIIHEECARKGKIHSHIDTLIHQYVNGPDHSLVLLAEEPGYLSPGNHEKKLFVLGPGQCIDALNCSGMNPRHFDMLWIGQKSVKNVEVGDPIPEDEAVNTLNKLKSYHGDNFGSLLMMISYCKLSTNRNELLEQSGINMPTFHVVGDIGTGKSKAADHLRSLLPYVKDENGSFYLNRDENPTESVLNSDLSVAGAPLIYDPALKISPAQINELLDACFQGVLNHNKHTHGKGNLKIMRGLMLF